MKGYHYKLGGIHLTWAVVVALILTFINIAHTQAGDPEDIIGPMNLDKFECLETREDPAEGEEEGEEIDPPEVVDLSEDLAQIKRESRGDIKEDIAKLEDACENATNREIFRPIARTKIEGRVFEFHPVDPENPAESEWFAVPSQDVPVIAEGVTFEIFWGSEPDGYFYFYKTRFGEGPIMLNLRLPEDAHPINPDILIESTGLDETWTVFLGFYRGDVPPPNIDQLKTPNGNFLPFGNTKFESIVGLDGESALPGVGGVLPYETPSSVMAVAAIVLIVLPAAGIFRLRNRPGE